MRTIKKDIHVLYGSPPSVSLNKDFQTLLCVAISARFCKVRRPVVFVKLRNSNKINLVKIKISI